MLKRFAGLAVAAAVSVSPIATAVTALSFTSTPAHASFCILGFCIGGGNGGNGGGTRGAPAPLLGFGAGLPVLAVGGAYWLVRRYRRKSDAA
jgi:hypothetical protein